MQMKRRENQQILWPTVSSQLLSIANQRSHFIWLVIYHYLTANISHGQTCEKTTDHSLEAAVVVRGCAKHYGLDKERLVAVALLVSPDDTKAPAAGVAPPQHNLMTAVQVAATKDERVVENIQ